MKFSTSGSFPSISIHTPIQGVTRRSLRWLSFTKNFNPHSHTGSDKWRGSAIKNTLTFQSTLPYREWLRKQIWFTSEVYFNPHSHTGSDKISIRRGRRKNAFQSTLPYREWRNIRRHYRILWRISIHTPIQGVTPWPAFNPIPSFNFNPHSHTGSDEEAVEGSFGSLISIHTPIQGVTWFFTHVFISFLFQSTLPYREWHIKGLNSEQRVVISIHTPIQGVTFKPGKHENSIHISIHTPIQGVTAIMHKICNCFYA